MSCVRGSFLKIETITECINILTVGVPVWSDVLGRAGQVEDDQLGLVRLVHDLLVEADSRVHPAHVRRLVSARGTAIRLIRDGRRNRVVLAQFLKFINYELCFLKTELNGVATQRRKSFHSRERMKLKLYQF